MKVTLALRGGLAAAVYLNRPPRQVDSADLPTAAAAELSRLAAAAMAAPEPRAARPMPDAMSYTITIEDSGRQTVLKQSDTAMSPSFADLLGWLQRHSAKE
jgi:hypothetical protein